MSDVAGRCAHLSSAAAEALAGTASRVVRWLLVEQPGSWGEDALVESKLADDVARTLQSAGRRHGFRTLLIRRPGWRKPPGDRRVYLARTLPAGGWVEQLDVHHEHDLVHLDWKALDSTVPPGVGAPGPSSVHLVCTNGRHDPCCADLGRPVVRALDDSATPEVWESSHVGGDRFAANIVVLPSGVYLGRVEPGEAAAMLAELERGLLPLDHYRGRSCYLPMVQAAEVFARRQLGERRLDALRVVRRTPDGDSRVRVTLDHDGTERTAIVSRTRGEPQLLSCGNLPQPPWRYRLERLE